MKSCLWCGNPCQKYFKEIAPACSGLLGSEQEQLRIQTAEGCTAYTETPQRFFFYSNGEPYTL